MGIFILTGAIIGGSSIGAVANFIPVKTSFAKNAWRSGMVATIFLVPAVVEYFVKTRTGFKYKEILTLKQYFFLTATLLC